MRLCRRHPATFLLCLVSFCFSIAAEAQEAEKFTTFGVQYRPILAAPLLNTGPVSSSNEEFSTSVTPRLGHDFGVVIRWGIGERFAIETGIDQIRRNFSIEVEDQKSSRVERMEFAMLAYQLPLRALLYVQIGERFYSNISAGAVADIMPTDWSGSEGNISHFTQRFNWIVGGFTANIGFEYRTPDAGNFYLGGTYHRPFTDPPDYRADVAAIEVQYQRSKRVYEETLLVPGDYITLDLKYFFPRGD